MSATVGFSNLSSAAPGTKVPLGMTSLVEAGRLVGGEEA